MHFLTYLLYHLRLIVYEFVVAWKVGEEPDDHRVLLRRRWLGFGALCVGQALVGVQHVAHARAYDSVSVDLSAEGGTARSPDMATNHVDEGTFAHGTGRIRYPG